MTPLIPARHDVLSAAVYWIANLLTGTLATSIAVITIAMLGFAMMSGRLAVRAGLRSVLGCFVLFGASPLAEALAQMVRSSDGPISAQPASVSAPPSPLPPPEFDPYAGASVPN